METRKELTDKLTDLGFSVETIQEVLTMTAPIRHGERVEAARIASSQWCRDEGIPLPEIAGAVLCWAEHWGLHGGSVYRPGCGTARHVAFSGLGKGRRHASDGEVWTSAIYEAGQKVWPWKGREDHGWELDVIGSELVARGHYHGLGSVVSFESILDENQLKTLVNRMLLEGFLDPIQAAHVLEGLGKPERKEKYHEDYVAR